jgi:hypothetical protein
MSDKHRTEEVFDNEIHPLLTRIFEIADREGIPLLVSCLMVMRGVVGHSTTVVDLKKVAPELREVAGALAAFHSHMHNSEESPAENEDEQWN